MKLAQLAPRMTAEFVIKSVFLFLVLSNDFRKPFLRPPDHPVLADMPLCRCDLQRCPRP
jgi:hypothetical protein